MTNIITFGGGFDRDAVTVKTVLNPAHVRHLEHRARAGGGCVNYAALDPINLPANARCKQFAHDTVPRHNL
jgi:hypothetical protein